MQVPAAAEGTALATMAAQMNSKRIAGVTSTALVAVVLAACDMNLYFYYPPAPSSASGTSTTTTTTTSGTTGGSGGGTTSSSGGGMTSGSGGGSDGGTTSGSGGDAGMCMQAPAPSVVWADEASTGNGTAIATDPAGNILVTGIFSVSIDFGLGPPDGGDMPGFVVELDPSGAPLWDLAFGSQDTGTGSAAASITSDSAGNVLLAGGFIGSVDFGGGPLMSVGAQDAFVAELLEDGTFFQATSFGTAGVTSATSIAVDGGGDVVVTGNFNGSVQFGSTVFTNAGQGDVFVVELHQQNWTPVWATRLGGQGAAEIQATGGALDGDGNVFVTGLFSGTVDGCLTPLVSMGPRDLFVAKLDPQGNCMWAQDVGGVDAVFASSPAIATDNAGHVILTGSCVGSVNFDGGSLDAGVTGEAFVALLGKNGEYMWGRVFESMSSSQGSQGTSVATDGAGNVLVTGEFIGPVDFGCGPLTSSGNTGVFVAELDASGATTWVKEFPTSGGANGITADATGNAYVTGVFTGSIDFGNGPIMSNDSDVFIAKLSP
jgi:hypothetical protein